MNPVKKKNKIYRTEVIKFPSNEINNSIYHTAVFPQPQLCYVMLCFSSVLFMDYRVIVELSFLNFFFAKFIFIYLIIIPAGQLYSRTCNHMVLAKTKNYHVMVQCRYCNMRLNVNYSTTTHGVRTLPVVSTHTLTIDVSVKNKVRKREK